MFPDFDGTLSRLTIGVLFVFLFVFLTQIVEGLRSPPPVAIDAISTGLQVGVSRVEIRPYITSKYICLPCCRIRLDVAL